LAVVAVDELRATHSDVPPLEDCDEAKVRSALAQPFQSAGGIDAYPDDASQLGAFVYFLAKSHMCWTGAKRVTAALTLAMLGYSGCWLITSPDELADVITGCAVSDPADISATLEWAQKWAASAIAC
jgi:prophage maintenance system killer protein